MLVIKENNRVYIAESIFPFVSDGSADQLLVPENMPIFKAKHSNTLIAGTEPAELDPLRYSRLPFPKVLTLQAMVERIMPTFRSILLDLGRADEDGELCNIVFAKGDKAFVIYSNNVVNEIADELAVGWENSYFNYVLACNKGLPLMRRINDTFRAVGNITGENLFPLIVTDTVSLKIQLIEEDTPC